MNGDANRIGDEQIVLREERDLRPARGVPPWFRGTRSPRRGDGVEVHHELFEAHRAVTVPVRGDELLLEERAVLGGVERADQPDVAEHVPHLDTAQPAVAVRVVPLEDSAHVLPGVAGVVEEDGLGGGRVRAAGRRRRHRGSRARARGSRSARVTKSVGAREAITDTFSTLKRRGEAKRREIATQFAKSQRSQFEKRSFSVFVSEISKKQNTKRSGYAMVATSSSRDATRK
jgi:hypothetical protein